MVIYKGALANTFYIPVLVICILPGVPRLPLLTIDRLLVSYVRAVGNPVVVIILTWYALLLLRTHIVGTNHL